MPDPYNPKPPRQYAETVLGKAASSEQLDELFELHAAAHPLVEHSEIPNKLAREVADQPETVRCDTVVFLSRADGGDVIASGQAICNPGDQWSRRLGVTIAFGRALKTLRERVGRGAA